MACGLVSVDGLTSESQNNLLKSPCFGCMASSQILDLEGSIKPYLDGSSIHPLLEEEEEDELPPSHPHHCQNELPPSLSGTPTQSATRGRGRPSRPSPGSRRPWRYRRHPAPRRALPSSREGETPGKEAGRERREGRTPLGVRP